jgi:hypothetical protein
MAMAAAEPSPAAVMTFARGVDGVPCCPDAGDAGTSGGVGDDPAVVVGGAAEAGQQAVVGQEPGPDEHCRSGYDPAGVELDAGQAVVLDDDRLTGSVTMPTARAASCSRWSAVNADPSVK